MLCELQAVGKVTTNGIANERDTRWARTQPSKHFFRITNQRAFSYDALPIFLKYLDLRVYRVGILALACIMYLRFVLELSSSQNVRCWERHQCCGSGVADSK